jgi:hypothetical protein
MKPFILFGFPMSAYALEDWRIDTDSTCSNIPRFPFYHNHVLRAPLYTTFGFTETLLVDRVLKKIGLNWMAQSVLLFGERRGYLGEEQLTSIQ